MAKTVYHRTSLGSGAGGLKGIAGNLLLNEDVCFINENNITYMYLLDADLGGVESSPDRVAPDVNPGTKMWVLQNYLSTGFTATSTSVNTIGAGSKTFTIQTNKGFVVGMSVKIASTADPTKWMHGDITTYTQATGELIVTVTSTKGTGVGLAAWTISASAPAVIDFTRGGTIINTVDYISAMNTVVWYATMACRVTNVRGYRVGGGATTSINARRNGASSHLAVAKTLAAADTWYDGGAVQDTDYAVGDKLEIMVVVSGALLTQIAVQVDFIKI
jgi:hypothetical protein